MPYFVRIYYLLYDEIIDSTISKFLKAFYLWFKQYKFYACEHKNRGLSLSAIKALLYSF